MLCESYSISIFLASSEELVADRVAFGNFCRKIDDILSNYGRRLRLLVWEDFGADYNLTRKQDEYNDKIRESDLFVVLFKTKGGQYTIEEFDVATESLDRNGILVCQKKLENSETKDDSLVDFYERIRNQFEIVDYSFIDKVFMLVMEKIKLFFPKVYFNIYVKGNAVVWNNVKIASKNLIK